MLLLRSIQYLGIVFDKKHAYRLLYIYRTLKPMKTSGIYSYLKASMGLSIAAFLAG